VKKILSILCVLLSLNFFVNAQDKKEDKPPFKIPELVDDSKSYIAAYFGISIPVDQFAETKDKENAGFAKPGLKANVDGAYIFYKNLGIGGTLGYFVNNTQTPEYFKQFGVTQILNESDYSSSGWKNAYFGFGPYFSLPESKLFFEGRFLVGMAYTQSPDMQLKISPNIHRFSEDDWSIATTLSLGLGVKLGKQWRLVMQTEFFNANPEFSLRHTIANDGLAIETENNYTQRISHFSLSMGLELDLTR